MPTRSTLEKRVITARLRQESAHLTYFDAVTKLYRFDRAEWAAKHPPQSSIALSDDGVDKASGPGKSASKEREMIEFTGEKHEN